MRYLADYIKAKGMAPTLGEVGGHFGVSKVTIFEHLVQMEKKGLIKRVPSKSRGIAILDPDFVSRTAARIPLVGRIAAGAPIEAVEQTELVDLQDIVKPDKDYYLLRVKGNSMKNDLIADGDYVIVEKRSTARNGEIVVAITGDNEATLKRFYKEGKRFRLQPANETMAPIYADNVEIRGVVAGIVRKY
jgi:repressor LexA